MKLLITGPPRSGKSTLIEQLIEGMNQKHYDGVGFLTPEVRKNNKRIGFDIKDIKTEKKIPLARRRGKTSNHRLGSYYIYVERFNEYLRTKFIPYLKKRENEDNLVVIIDEIGKMELFSSLFQDFITNIFHSNYSIIGTIGKTLKHPVKDELLAQSEVKLYNLERENFNKIFEAIKTQF
ncbi:MAG: nucleoside-triphosphatase [Promethearchaeia archaeon]